MSLAADKSYGDPDSRQALREMLSREPGFDRWMEHSCSELLHHDAECCERARLWFLAYARSMEIGALSQYRLRAPTWLSQLYTWGPTNWPISWCQVVQEDVIDCGVFAVLAREVFKAQGFEAHPAQALLSYSDHCTGHWKALWKNGHRQESLEKVLARSAPIDIKREKSTGKVFPWVGEQVVYHELCLVETPAAPPRFTIQPWATGTSPFRAPDLQPCSPSVPSAHASLNGARSPLAVENGLNYERHRS